MADVWVVESYIYDQGSLDYLGIEGVWSSAGGAVAHLEGVRGAVCDDPDYELIEDTTWTARDGYGVERVFFVSRNEVLDG